MLFNSVDFAIFLPLVFLLYWFVTATNLKLQNLLIVAASYIFYGWWDWRFLSLLLFSTLVDYLIGILLSKQKTQHKRKLLLWLSIAVNLGFLGFFKYFNFFIANFVAAFSFFGVPFSHQSLSIILPVGISFYTFQTLSYTIDIYKRKLEPTKDFIAFAAYVSFFPQLVAGPIERATNLLPQFYKKRHFDYEKAADGMRQILWGLFKKVVVADNAALIVNEVFDTYESQSGINLLIGAIFFSFQIYGDFSGYSDIAIGTSRLFGFDLKRNFNYPYFSRDIAEFWRRWHISLSTWFRDYLYIPLGGSQGKTSFKVRNTFIIFIVSGFWHGANWTFLFWGFLNAVFFIPLLLNNKNRTHLEITAQANFFPNATDFYKIIKTFLMTTLMWLFFRSLSIGDAFLYLKLLFSPSLFVMPSVSLFPFLFILVLLVIEWFSRKKQHGLELSQLENKNYRRLVYLFIIIMLILFRAKSQSFIYFQF